MSDTKLVGYGVDTLILNMRYTDEQYQPFKRELAEEIAYGFRLLSGVSNSSCFVLDVYNRRVPL